VFFGLERTGKLLIVLLYQLFQGRPSLVPNQRESSILEDLKLPPKTLLLVQLTCIYTKKSGKLKPYTGRTKVLFIVDACRINNDDISALDYPQRLNAIRKFCHAFNRGAESIATDRQQQQTPNPGKRRFDKHPAPVQNSKTIQTYYLHCAEITALSDLREKFSELHPEFIEDKCLQLAVNNFEFPDDLESNATDLYIPCQAVRFVQHYKGRISKRIIDFTFFSQHRLMYATNSYPSVLCRVCISRVPGSTIQVKTWYFCSNR
jgi:hypothetical protein